MQLASAVVYFSTTSLTKALSNHTFLGGGEVLGVRHFGSKLSILLQNMKSVRKRTAKSFLCGNLEQQEILEVQAKGN